MFGPTRGRLGIVLAACAFLLLAAAESRGNFSVDRQVVELQLRPGQRVTGAIGIANRSEDPIRLQVVPNDYTMDEDGQPVTHLPGETERSLLPYISLETTQISLEPHQRGALRYVIDIPPDAKGSYWIALHVEPADVERLPVYPMTPVNTEDVPEEIGDATISIRLIVRYRVLILVTVQGTEEREGRVLGVRRLAEDEPAFEVKFENSSNIYYRASGWVDIRDASGDTVQTLSLHEATVLPGHVRTLRTGGTGPEGLPEEAPPLPAGEYAALAVVDFGGEELAAGMLRFTVGERPQRSAESEGEDE